MKSIDFKSILKFLISLAVAAFLIWLVFKDVDLNAMLLKLKEVNFGWVVFSIILAIVSHLARAYRWNILLQPFGYQLSTFRTFLAIMVGYFFSLIVPRMGEVVRCGMLKRTDDVEVPRAFGTVVAERVFDTMALFLILAIGLVIEFDRLGNFFAEVFAIKEGTLSQLLPFLYVILAVVITVSLIGYYVFKTYKATIKNNSFYQKVQLFLISLKEGILSIKRIQNKTGFWVSTLAIWFFYFLMSYVVFNAMEATSGLGVGAGLSILIMSAFGMAAPVQGGIGAYHALVSSTLLLYGVPKEDGVLFATVVHTANALMVIIVGSISLLLTVIISKKRNRD